MKTTAVFIVVFVTVFAAVFLFWPARPLHTCEDFLNSPIADCDFTKGHTK